jgi:hypothetical protein
MSSPIIGNVRPLDKFCVGLPDERYRGIVGLAFCRPCEFAQFPPVGFRVRKSMLSRSAEFTRGGHVRDESGDSIRRLL